MIGEHYTCKVPLCRPGTVCVCVCVCVCVYTHRNHAANSSYYSYFITRVLKRNMRRYSWCL